MGKGYHINAQFRITDMSLMFKKHLIPNYIFIGHKLAMRECLYVMRGEIQITCDDITHQLKSGDIIIYNPNEFYKYFVNDKNGCDVFVFSYNASGPLANFFDNKTFKLLPEHKNILNELISLLKPDFLGDLNLTSYLTHYSDACLQLIALRLETLFLMLYKHYYESGISDSYDDIIIKKAVKYMHSNIYDQPTIESIAEHCEVSVSKLKHVFSERYGIGIHKYFISLKICRATQLLKSGRNVSQISEILGFASQPYFSTCFKRETGLTPSEYKNKYL